MTVPKILGRKAIGIEISEKYCSIAAKRLSQSVMNLEIPKEVINQARQSGHGVFINFTADWCINCQVNDRFVLENPKVRKAFKDQGIIAFKGDWTKYDPAITKALASFGRDSIPVYVYYPPGSNAFIILPQLITPKMILERAWKK